MATQPHQQHKINFRCLSDVSHDTRQCIEMVPSHSVFELPHSVRAVPVKVQVMCKQQQQFQALAPGVM